MLKFATETGKGDVKDQGADKKRQSSGTGGLKPLADIPLLVRLCVPIPNPNQSSHLFALLLDLNIHVNNWPSPLPLPAPSPWFRMYAAIAKSPLISRSPDLACGGAPGSAVHELRAPSRTRSTHAATPALTRLTTSEKTRRPSTTSRGACAAARSLAATFFARPDGGSAAMTAQMMCR